jgi:hypothetical protein
LGLRKTRIFLQKGLDTGKASTLADLPDGQNQQRLAPVTSPVCGVCGGG